MSFLIIWCLEQQTHNHIRYATIYIKHVTVVRLIDKVYIVIILCNVKLYEKISMPITIFICSILAF